MKKSSVEQAYIARERLLRENEGAAESSRAALSGISGQNIQKTEEAAQKIQRDTTIAEQQAAAIVATGEAAGAVTLERQKAAHGQNLDHNRRIEALMMLNEGVYSPDFAAELGYSDGIIKEYAEKRQKEITAKKAKAAAVESARQKYEEALASINERRDKQPTKEEEPTYEAYIIDKEGKRIGTDTDEGFNLNKEASLKTAEKEADRNVPYNVMADNPLAQMSRFANEPTTRLKTAPNSTLKKDAEGWEKLTATRKEAQKKAKAVVEDRYDRILAQRVVAAEKAKKELTDLEKEFTESETGKIKVAQERFAQAKDYNSGRLWSAYCNSLKDGVKAVVDDTDTVLTGAGIKMEKGENLTKEDIADLKGQKDRLQAMIETVREQMDKVDFSPEGSIMMEGLEAGLQAYMDRVEFSIEYEETFEENASQYKTAYYESRYGAFTDEELRQKIEANKVFVYEGDIDIKAISKTINKNIVEVLKASSVQERNQPQKHDHVGVVDFDQREVYLADDNTAYRLELCIANLTNGAKIAYVKRYIEKATTDIAKKIKKAETAEQSRLNQLSNSSISPIEQKSQEKNSDRIPAAEAPTDFYSRFLDSSTNGVYNQLSQKILAEQRKRRGILLSGTGIGNLRDVPIFNEDGSFAESSFYYGHEQQLKKKLEEGLISEEKFLKQMDLLRNMAESAAEKRDEQAQKKKSRNKLGERIRGNYLWFRRRITDAGAAVYDIEKKYGLKYLYAYYNAARQSKSVSDHWIFQKRSDVNGNILGEGLNDVFRGVMDRGKVYQNDFEKYLLHMHNVERMSIYDEQEHAEVRRIWIEKEPMYRQIFSGTTEDIKEIAKDPYHELYHVAQGYLQDLREYDSVMKKLNKPVFGWGTTAEDSRTAAALLLQQHPEFEALAERVYQYEHDLMQLRVDSGLVSQEFAEFLWKKYPHYVPTAREGERTKAEKVNALTKTSKTVGRAEGGETKILPIYDQLVNQTKSAIRHSANNRFGQQLLNAYHKKGEYMDHIHEAQSMDIVLESVRFMEGFETEDPWGEIDQYKNGFTVFLNGEQWLIDADENMMDAWNALAPEKKEVTDINKFGAWSVAAFKKVTTGLSPFFMIRNFARDFGDGFFNTKYPGRWLKNYGRALSEIWQNSELWQKYQALGGVYATFSEDLYNLNEGNLKSGAKKISQRMQFLNMAVEQLPRFSEFISTIEAEGENTNTIMEALHNAADITTNFGRAGTTGRFLNQYWIPFFNPGVQGASKFVRRFTETRGGKDWARLVLQATICGFAPALINSFIYDDDEEWEMLDQRTKDTHFLFKIGDGYWLKVPYGRVCSVLGMSAARVKQLIQGEEIGWADIISTGGTVLEQVAPANPITNNIIGPMILAAMNKTWYGGEIESRSLQMYAPGQRYDNKTDVISKWIGSWSNISPKKINYLLDSYSGVIGDFLLPMLTPAQELSVFVKSFAVDVEASNRLSVDFYNALDQATWTKNAKGATMADTAYYKWMNRNSSGLSEFTKSIRAIELDDTLTKAEKKEAIREIQKARNAFLKKIEENTEAYKSAAAKAEQNGVAEDMVYHEANRKIFGTEEALKIYREDTYERAVEVQKEYDVDFDTFWEIYFDDSVDNDQCFKMLDAGIEKESTLKIAKGIEALDPESGKETVSYIQKYEAIAAADVSNYEKAQAMQVFASDADLKRYNVVLTYDISVDHFLQMKRNIETVTDRTDLSGASNAVVQAAVDQIEGLENHEKAVLWQAFTSSKSSKNNPYDPSVGDKVLALKETNEFGWHFEE